MNKIINFEYAKAHIKLKRAEEALYAEDLAERSKSPQPLPSWEEINQRLSQSANTVGMTPEEIEQREEHDIDKYKKTVQALKSLDVDGSSEKF